MTYVSLDKDQLKAMFDSNDDDMFDKSCNMTREERLGLAMLVQLQYVAYIQLS